MDAETINKRIHEWLGKCWHEPKSAPSKWGWDLIARCSKCDCQQYRPPTTEPAESEGNVCEKHGLPYDTGNCQPPAESVEDAKAFKRVAIELRIRFPVEIQYNSEFEAMVKRLEGGSL